LASLWDASEKDQRMQSAYKLASHKLRGTRYAALRWVTSQFRGLFDTDRPRLTFQLRFNIKLTMEVFVLPLAGERRANVGPVLPLRTSL